MNQILFSFDDKNSQNIDNGRTKQKSKKLSLSNFQFIISIIILIVLVFALLFYLFSLFKKENQSNELIDNYSIFKLYSDQNISSNESDNNIFGIIEIPKINIYYPIISKISDEALKVAPCKISGNGPDKNSNLCIAGHNYNNSMFFSNLNLLNNNDEIFIYYNDTKFVYYVFNKYEVDEGDLTPISDYTENTKELTLITCNNFNSKRIIVKSKQRAF